MQNFSPDLLEFESLRQLLGRFVHSRLGHDELDLLEPQSSRAELESTLADVAEAITYLRASLQPQSASRGAAIRIRFDSLPDISTSLPMLRIEGAALEAKQLLELTRLLEQAGEIRSLLNIASAKYPRLGARATTMHAVDVVNSKGQVLQLATRGFHDADRLATDKWYQPTHEA